jgi:hypothetical protein
MFTWTLLIARTPQPGQFVDWMAFDGEEVRAGRYLGRDRWARESAPVVGSHLVAAWRPAVDFQDTAEWPVP